MRHLSDILSDAPTHLFAAMKPGKRLLALFSFVLLCARVVSANLGQTPPQVEARYGSGKEVLPETPADAAKGYTFHKLHILVEYWQGASASEQYQNIDKSAITEAQAAALLADSAGAANWRQTSEDTWVRTDKAAIAYLADGRKVLVVQLYSYHVEEKKSQEQPSEQ